MRTLTILVAGGLVIGLLQFRSWWFLRVARVYLQVCRSLVSTLRVWLWHPGMTREDALARWQYRRVWGHDPGARRT